MISGYDIEHQTRDIGYQRRRRGGSIDFGAWPFFPSSAATNGRARSDTKLEQRTDWDQTVVGKTSTAVIRRQWTIAYWSFSEQHTTLNSTAVIVIEVRLKVLCNTKL
jgi:hypothetical protein